MPPTDGCLARYIVQDADFCFKLPDGVTYEEGAFMEPLAVAVHACRRAQVQMGQRILVQGAGPVGACSMMTARAIGAAQVAITDLNTTRLEHSKKLGAEHTICIEGMSVNDVRAAVIQCLGGEPDVTIECTGAQSCLESSILTTRSGGVVVLVGLGDERAELPVVDPTLREVDIRGAIKYANCFPIALSLVATGKIDLSGLTRVHYKLEQVHEAYERKQHYDVMKVFITCEK
ncbi:L-iditol 2-dehydrogenase domain protein [Ancylostoma caninum]|uniref:Sorbitol dehydrogenase n=1 Tax=Ancylostoma caninum TaxID=29170 RepID=A0A368H1Z8_ANCCA|nr:L-iditol 2-dehydrogenase domain protein [Ancylostoma caninum]